MLAASALARFAHFAATSILFGGAAFPFYAGSSLPARRVHLLLAGFSLLALLTRAAELIVMAVGMNDAWSAALDPGALASVVTDTRFGRVWTMRLLIAAATVAVCLGMRQPRSLAALALSGALLASIALTGHSAIPGGWAGGVHQIADAAHLLAAGWWTGGLLGLATLTSASSLPVATVLGRFSRIGYWAVAALVTTGLLKGAILVGRPEALVTSAYGVVLLLKILLFGFMGLLALSNRFQLTRALISGPSDCANVRRFHMQVVAEFTIGLLVLAAVGWLGAMPPPVAQ